MIRKAFRMKLFDGMAEEYRRRHNLIWREMVDMIHEYGGHNYSIYLDPDSNILFGYIELEDEELWNRSAETEVCRRWWDYMADIMETNEDESPVSEPLKEVFYME